MTQRLAERAARALAPRVRRRSFLARSAMAGTALAAAPATFALKPRTAYAAVCGCSGSTCDCRATCCDGYTEFCCTLSGMNRCPPGTYTGGWWKVDGSGFCGGGARYYVDCNASCGSCGCGGSGICGGSCSGAKCGCAKGSCGNRKTGCTGFRYGQCHQNIACLGPIVCRVVTCIPPWQTDAACGTAIRVDNATASHHRPCLTGNPYGSFDAVTSVRGGLRVSGWAVDPSTVNPVNVHIYVDGVGRASVVANLARADVARAYPGAGSRHGFVREITDVAPGRHSVCIYAIDVGEGGNTRLGCRTASVSAAPFGGVNDLLIDHGKLRVRGWAIDPDTDAPIRVHVYVDGRARASLAADIDRPDVAARFGRGSRHGFDGRISIAPGSHRVDLYAIGVATGGNTRFGSGRVSWNGNPFGGVNSVTAVGGGRVRVVGWAIDGETSGPIRVHIYSDGRPVASIAADRERADLAPFGFGTAHGFDATVTVGAGAHSVCAYAIDVGSGSNVLLRCLPVNAT